MKILRARGEEKVRYEGENKGIGWRERESRMRRMRMRRDRKRVPKEEKYSLY